MPDLTFLEPYGSPARRHPAGATLFRAGADSAGLHLLLSGQIRLLRPLADGSEVVVHRAAAVDTFAEAAVFSAVYHCDAVAVTEVEVRIVPAAAVRAALAEVPHFATRFAARLAGQVQDLRARAEILSMRGAAERAAAWLALRADGDTVVLERPVKDIAAEIGLTHEALYRALAALERDGRIERLARGRYRLAARPQAAGA